MSLNKTAFFTAARPIFGALSGPQVDGIEKILDEWARRALTDLRWLAYMLATVKWETGGKMQPVREGGGEAYLRRKKYYPWVGEGLVQVSWEVNARKFGATAPGQLMTWPVALRALFDGMIDGVFTGKRLADYFNVKTTDWVSARRIINGTDKASEIAAVAKRFHAALIAASEPAKAVVALNAPAATPTVPTPAKSPTNWIAAAGAGIPAVATAVKGVADSVNSTFTQVNDSAGAVKNGVEVVRQTTGTWLGWASWHMPPSVLIGLGAVGLVAIVFVIYRHSRLLKDAAS